MGGFLMGLLIGACFAGVETCMWLHDSIALRERIKILTKKARELTETVINIMNEKMRIIEKNDRLREENGILRMEVDKYRREQQAKEWGKNDA